jgi:Flp pilus assembly protein TadB
VDRKLGIEDCLRKRVGEREREVENNGRRYSALDSFGFAHHRRNHDGPGPSAEVSAMIVLGLVLLILGLVLGISILTTIGVILIVIGAIFWILGSAGRPVGGRARWY